ncbi:MAG: T9SS type A sorting domain-containing protein [Bacteroidota bacterium]
MTFKLYDSRKIETEPTICYIELMKISYNCLVRMTVVLFVAILCSGNASAQKKFLFDATKAETAGNADWVIDEDSNVPGRFPTPPESTITSATPETYWTGALSSWGIALVKMGHHVETLPPGARISYGDSTNVQDLKNYDVYIVDEPNVPFTASEKTAIVQFVQNGGGLFMISDHAGADRNNDGWDAVRIWNDVMRNNSVHSLPFGMLVDSTDYSETTTNILSDTTNPILHGSAGPVTELKYSDGATITLDTSANPTVRGVIWRSSYPQTLTNVMFATASFGTGRVCLIGDSSPADDGTGASGNSLYPGWTEVGVSHADLHLNGSLWLIKKESTAITLSARTLSFGEVGINDSTDVILKVTNGSLNPQVIDSIYTSTPAFESLITKATITTDTLNIDVRFFAKSVGAFVDTLFIRDKSDTSLIKVPLSGNSPFSILDVTPQPLNFGGAMRDSVKQIIFTIRDNSVSYLEVDSLYTHTNYFHVAAFLANMIVTKNDTVAVNIRFRPDSIRQYYDTLYIVNNSETPLAKFPVSGLGAVTNVIEVTKNIPASFSLSQNFPNPFNPTTLIEFSIPDDGYTSLKIYDLLGREVATLVDGEMKGGESYRATFDGSNFSSGIYFSRLVFKGNQLLKKLLLLK